MSVSCSTIGKKAILAVTGLVLAGFVLLHMLGNLLIFLGPEVYNNYGQKMVTNPLLYPAEAILGLAFLVHIYLAVTLQRGNFAARPQRYAMTTNGQKGVSLSSKTMIYHGFILMVFTVWHLITFKFGPTYLVVYNGVEMRDLYRLIIEVFSDPVYAISYTIVMGLLALHLFHGVSSLFQSWGFNHPVYTPILKKIGYAYALGVGLGFMSNPIFILINSLGGAAQ